MLGFGKQKFSRKMMLESRIEVLNGGATTLAEDNPVRKTALEYVRVAADALAASKFEQAWRNLVAGEVEILKARSDEEVSAKSRAIAAEIEIVLPGNEAKGILSVLPNLTPGIPPPPDWKVAVAETYSLYQRRVIQLMDARERTGARIWGLGVILAALLVGLLAIAYCHADVLQTAGVQGSKPADGAASTGCVSILAWLLLAMAVLGAIGACLSGLLSLTVLGQLPGQFESYSITLARPLVGATSGLIAALISTSNLVTFQSGSALAVIAFAFGFSERLIVGAVQKFETAQK